MGVSHHIACIMAFAVIGVLESTNHVYSLPFTYNIMGKYLAVLSV